MEERGNGRQKGRMLAGLRRMARSSVRQSMEGPWASICVLECALRSFLAIDPTKPRRANAFLPSRSGVQSAVLIWVSSSSLPSHLPVRPPPPSFLSSPPSPLLPPRSRPHLSRLQISWPPSSDLSSAALGQWRYISHSLRLALQNSNTTEIRFPVTLLATCLLTTCPYSYCHDLYFERIIPYRSLASSTIG